MKEPAELSDSETRAVNLSIAKIEAVTGNHVVALVMASPAHRLEVILSPGAEQTSLDACKAIDWNSLDLIVQEYTGC